MRNRRPAVATVVVTAVVMAWLSACSSGSDPETAAAPSSSSDVCSSADDLRGSLAALGDVEVAQAGAAAELDQAWQAVQHDWDAFADAARAEHADAVDGVQADVDGAQAAIDSAQSDPSAATLGALASAVGTFLTDAGALVDEVGTTC
jgi:hypothetical protein